MFRTCAYLATNDMGGCSRTVAHQRAILAHRCHSKARNKRTRRRDLPGDWVPAMISQTHEKSRRAGMLWEHLSRSAYYSTRPLTLPASPLISHPGIGEGDSDPRLPSNRLDSSVSQTGSNWAIHLFLRGKLFSLRDNDLQQGHNSHFQQTSRTVKSTANQGSGRWRKNRW